MQDHDKTSTKTSAIKGIDNSSPYISLSLSSFVVSETKSKHLTVTALKVTTPCNTCYTLQIQGQTKSLEVFAGLAEDHPVRPKTSELSSIS